MNTCKWWILPAALSFVLSACVQSKVPIPSVSVKNSENCIRRSSGICIENFDRLTTNYDASKHARQIELSGYVGVRDGFVYFASSQEAFEFMDFSQTIVFDGAKSVVNELVEKCNYRHCAVVGSFKYSSNEENTVILGSIVVEDYVPVSRYVEKSNQFKSR